MRLKVKQTRLFGSAEPEQKVLAELKIEAAETTALAIGQIVNPLCEKVDIVGSIRRKKQIVHDIDFVVVCSDANWKEIQRSFKNHICAGNIVFKFNFPINEEELFQCDIYRASEKNYGVMKLVRTGSGDHNCWIASLARSKGMMLKYSEGLVRGDVVSAWETEEGVFGGLGLPYIEPEKREIEKGKPIWMKDNANI
jgi:DNA polymerase (family 10)